MRNPIIMVISMTILSLSQSSCKQKSDYFYKETHDRLRIDIIDFEWRIKERYELDRNNLDSYKKSPFHIYIDSILQVHDLTLYIMRTAYNTGTLADKTQSFKRLVSLHEMIHSVSEAKANYDIDLYKYSKADGLMDSLSCNLLNSLIILNLYEKMAPPQPFYFREDSSRRRSNK